MSRNPSPNGRARSYSIKNESHAALQAGRVAVVTGAASGIGLAAASQFATLGLKVVLADKNQDALSAAEKKIASLAKGEGNVLAVLTDVARLEDVQRLRDRTLEAFGEVNVLMNNAGISGGPNGDVGTAFSNIDAWRSVLDVNLWGVINAVQVFTPYMIHQENHSMIINTGSKQGITSPPGNAAYNVSKAALKVVTENLSHELRAQGVKVTAHLFIPGWTFTGMTGSAVGSKPDGAYTAEETVQYMLDKVRLGDFYVVVPDNETPPQLDRLRMRWSAEDISENRPALSRWHPEFKPMYEEYIASGMAHGTQ